MASRRTNLAEGIKLVLTAAIAGSEIGTVGQTFDVDRVDFINLEIALDEAETFKLRIVPRASKAETPDRNSIPQHDSVAVMLLRRMAKDELSDSQIAAFVAECVLVMEQVETVLLKRANARPWQLVSGATDGPAFESFSYQTRGNAEELIYNPEALSQRRQFESRMVVTYWGNRGTD